MATSLRELHQLGYRLKDGKPVKIQPTDAPTGRVKIDGFDSKLERSFATYLGYLKRDGLVVGFIHHPPPIGITRANRYTADFLIAYSSGRIEFAEVKGQIREDDTLKCQMVKTLCPAVSVAMWRHVKGSWIKREF